MAITLYGASDDCIEIEGDKTEEWDLHGREKGDLVAFSDGTVLRIKYTPSGVWRITPVAVPHPDLLTITQAPEDDDSNYSDRAELRSKLAWAVQGINYLS